LYGAAFTACLNKYTVTVIDSELRTYPFAPCKGD